MRLSLPAEALRRTVVILLLLVLCGCGGARRAGLESGDAGFADPVPVAIQQLAFPDEEALLSGESTELSSQRGTSELFELVKTGIQFDEVNTHNKLQGQNLELLPDAAAGEYAWALYSFEGFTPYVFPTAVRTAFNVSSSKDCKVFIGLADFSRRRWQWTSAVGGEFRLEYDSPLRYSSNMGKAYVVVAAIGSGSALVKKLTMEQTIIQPPAPTNLVAEYQGGGMVHLSWAAQGWVDGYRVYSSTYSDFDPLTELSSELVTTNSFDHQTSDGGNVVYYYVTAMERLESQPSAPADVFVPESDLPAPQNLRILASDPESVTFGWDWDEPNPAGFKLFIKQEPNFDMRPPFFQTKQTFSPSDRQITITDVTQEEVYYARLAAYDGMAKLGQLTPDLAFSAGGWKWEREPIGAGQFEVSLVNVDGDKLACSFFNDKDEVSLGIRENGVWNLHDTGLNEDFDTNPSDAQEHHGFINWQSLAYHDGDYMIAAFSKESSNLCATFGNPADGWSPEILEGDSLNEEGLSSNIGLFCEPEFTDVTRLVLYTYQMGDGPGNAKPWLRVKNNVTGVWEQIAGGDQTGVLPWSGSITTFGGRFWMVAQAETGSNFELHFNRLTFAHAAEGIDPDVEVHKITDSGPVKGYMAGSHTDVHRYKEAWVTPSHQAYGTEDMDVWEGDLDSWTMAAVDTGPGKEGQYAQIAVDGDKLFLVYLNQSDYRYYFAWYDGAEWKHQLLAVPLDEIFVHVTGIGLDVEYLNHEPYIAFWDYSTGQITCARGVPPA